MTRERGPYPDRSLRLFLTLLDLGREHKLPRLTELAREVYRKFVIPRIEVEDHYVQAVIEMAAAALGPDAGEGKSCRRF